MSGRRKSVTGVPGVGLFKKPGSRRLSQQLQADSTDADTKTSTRKKYARRSSIAVTSTQPSKKEPTSQKKEKPVYDVEATKKFESMLRGDLSDLPPLPKTMVKIFLSSTFSDMRAERNTLAREVYPSLQSFCASLDLDFQVVDMRWGVTEDSINDHSVENLCLLEIENCQKTSVGPNFVVLSGDRYGYRPIPVNIDVETFDIIQREANKLHLQNRELLEEWYKLDENATPNTYVLQPIRSKFKFFGDFSPGCDKKREKDTTEWWRTFEKLQVLLRESADEAFKDDKFTAERKHQFFQSVTESEIQVGLLKAQEVDLHCLVYKRRMRHLRDVGLNDKDSPRYIDVIKSDKGNTLDEDAEKLKVLLFEDRICKTLKSENIKEYSVHWMPGGVNPEKSEEHREYISTFCQDFIADFKRLILQAEEEKKKKAIKQSNYYTDHYNTVHHLQFCVSKCESFCGQEQVLEAAKSYILDMAMRKPLVIYAPSGCGKTSVMAMIMKSIPEWLNNAPHLRLIRFLGTSPQYKNVFDVLVDVLGNLSDVYEMILPPHNCKTMKDVVQFTPRYIRQVANHAKEPIVILLDCLDQLDSRNNAYAMDWLPISLPANVKLIVSTLPKEHSILANLKKRLPDRECYIEIPTLTKETAKQIVESNLKAHNRTLTDSQMNFFCSIFEKTPSPLLLKLLLDEARMWKSFSPQSEMKLVSTVKEAISKRFKTLINKFGTLLVSHALGFITVSLSGLTEFEIDDALSCDDDVLNEVYRFHDPPVPGIVQIPPLLWARIWYDIRGYLVERRSYGKTTLNWYHREFVHVATDMFTKGGNDVTLNKTLYEIYLQENGVKRTMMLKNRNQLVITDADRQVNPQPYNAENKRKLACLPYHTLRAYKAIGKNQVKAEVYCNFKYLYAKITAFSVSAVVNDLSDFLQETSDEEVRILFKFFANCKHDLSHQTRLAFCLLAYVNPEKTHNQLKNLLKEAAEFLDSRNKSGLIPDFPCLAQRHGASDASESSVQGVFNILAVSNCNILLQRQVEETGNKCSVDTNISVWSTDTQELTDVQTQDDEGSVSKYILADDFLYYITRSAIVRFWISDCNSETVPFTDIASDWEGSVCVRNIFANSDTTVGALVKDSSITLISLGNFEYLQEFKTPNLPIAYAFVIGSGKKLIAICNTPRSHKEIRRHDRSNVTVIVFEQGKNLPIQKFEFSESLDCKKAVLSCRDTWLLIPTLETAASEQCGKQSPLQPEGSNDHLLAFEIDKTSCTSREIKVSSKIAMLSVHPEKRKIIYLTDTGQVHSVLAESVDLTINVNFTIKTFTVSWDDEIGIFCTTGRKLVMYDLKSDNICLEFVAHGDKIKEIYLLDQQLITLGEDMEMKSWTMKTLLKQNSTGNISSDIADKKDTILEQTNVVAITQSHDGNELMTSHDDHLVKMWYMESQNHIRQYNIEIVGDIVHVFPNRTIVFHDSKAGKMRVISSVTGREKFQLPETIHTILHSTSDARENVFILSSLTQEQCQIDILSVEREIVVKTINLKESLSYKSIDTVLSANQKYLVLRMLMSRQDLDEIKDLHQESIPVWMKSSGGLQNDKYRFAAVMLSKNSGTLIHCNQNADGVPATGTLMLPHKGNTMLISTRRWIAFWDISTGGCDRKSSKLPKTPMFYRQSWTGRESLGGTRVLQQSGDGMYVACGSDDGYMFVYNSDTGLPVCSRKPLTKHNAEVHNVVISPDSKLVASSCQNSILKLWEISTGLEQFSVRLDANVRQMCFSPDSSKLVVYTGTYTTRVMLFTVSRSGK